MNFGQLLSDLIWIIPTTLLIIAIIQSIYWIYLLRGATTTKRSQRTNPMMPTHPQYTKDRSGMSRDDEVGDYSDNVIKRGGFQGEMRVLENTLSVPKIRMPKNSFKMGRFYNPDDDILIAFDDRSISRKHAEFVTRDDGFYLTDINSSYGTSVFIEDRFQPLTPNQPEQVFHDDVVLFGNTVKVQLKLPGGTR